jgi:hypothetical protein
VLHPNPNPSTLTLILSPMCANCPRVQGAYRDDAGKPLVLDSVREAERRVSGSHFMEYLPIGGEQLWSHL